MKLYPPRAFFFNLYGSGGFFNTLVDSFLFQIPDFAFITITLQFVKFFIPVYLYIVLLVSAICFSSCRTQYVPVEKIKTEYRYIDRLQHDSVYLKDSVRYYTRGDTVFADKYLYLYKYLFINKVDSFTKTDSIQVPYPVERKLTRWQSIKMELGGW